MAKQKITKQKQSGPVIPPSVSTRTTVILFLVIAFFSFFLYGNTLNHEYALDDDVITKANKYVQEGIKGIPEIISKSFYYGFNGVNEGAYRPVVLVNMAIETQLWGNNPRTGHFFNVLLYALSCVLLFVFLRKLFKEKSYTLPFIITLLFTAHPIHTEVVANIKSRDEILCFLFIVLTLNLLLKYVSHKKPGYLILSLICYFLGLVTKEYGLTLAGVIPVMLYIFSDKRIKTIIYLTIPYCLVALLYLMLRSSILDNLAFEKEMDVINNSLVAASNYSERLATTVSILGKYIVLLVFPHPLSYDYSYNQIPIVNWSSIKALLSLLTYLGLIIFSVIGIKKKDPVAFSIVFYLFTLLLVSNLLVDIGATLAERFLFIPSMGFCIALVLLVSKITGYNPLSGNNKTTFYGIIAVVLISYSFKTIDRNKDWKNNLTLFTADVQACPNSARTHFSLASTLNNLAGSEANPVKKTQMLQKAIIGFKKSIEIYPEFSTAWYNMGVAYYSMGNPEEAGMAYQKTIAINPGDKQALNNLGVIYFNRKEYTEALKYFQEAVKRNPSFSDPYANIGAVYHNQGDYDNAIIYYNKTLQFNPNNKNVLSNLSKLYRNMGDEEKANYYSTLSQKP